MSVIKISNLTFGYDGSYENIFENVSFNIDSHWKLGFTGRNGRGKTTFLNLLMGKYPYQGNISSCVEFEYFPYEVYDKSELTADVLRQIYSGYAEWELLRELSLLGVDENVLYRPFESLSSGEQTKTLLAVMFLKPNRFLLIDEPTNHLDMRAREQTAAYLNKKSGFILVSHDRCFLDSCVDHILSINKTGIDIKQGNFSSWLRLKQLEDDYETAQNKKLKKEIGRLSETSREKAQWSDKTEASKIGSHAADRGYIGHKSAKMMKRSKSIEKRINSKIEQKEKLLKNIESAERLKLKPLKFHSERLLQLSDVSLSYGENEILKSISFTVNQGDRIALCGKNGSGKSSIIKLILGENISFAGEFYKASGLKISYIPQVVSVCGSIEDFEALNGLESSLFRAVLRKLDFSREQFDRDLSCCSAGQKKKLFIAKSLCEQAHLYVWDEPMNYIDVLSRQQIEQLLAEYSPTMLFVEHDKAFCENIANKTIEL